MRDFPLFEQDHASQQSRARGGAWRGGGRVRDFDTQSVQTNEGAWSRYGQGGSANAATAFFDCIRNLHVHVETMITRFHDLYARKGRTTEANRLNEKSIKFLCEHQYDGERIGAALHLLTETYKRSELPQAAEAEKSLTDWWEYIRLHRHPNRNPSGGEVEYEEEKAEKAKAAALELWDNYNMLLEDQGRWLDTYIAEVTARETEAHMNLRIQALNAVDKEFALGTNLRQGSAWFDNKRSIPSHRRRALISNSRLSKDKLDFDNMGHFEARKADKDRIMKIFNQYRIDTQVMGETSKDHQRAKAIIDTGDEGPNIVSLSFLSKLKLEKIIETDLDGESVTDASGNEFRPLGWVELYFKFEKIQGGWHSSLFWVADVQNYDLIIGMPCLLQENIKSKVIAPLVPNQSQKKKEKDKSQTPDDRGSQDRQERSQKRRKEIRKDDLMNWAGASGNGNGNGNNNNNSGGVGGSGGGGNGSKPTIAFLGLGRHNIGRLPPTVEEVLEEEVGTFNPPSSLAGSSGSNNQSYSSKLKQGPAASPATHTSSQEPPVILRCGSKMASTNLNWADEMTSVEADSMSTSHGKLNGTKTPEKSSSSANLDSSGNGASSASGLSARHFPVPLHLPPRPANTTESTESWRVVMPRKGRGKNGGSGIGSSGVRRSVADAKGG